jgi:hypothetical protein
MTDGLGVHERMTDDAERGRPEPLAEHDADVIVERRQRFPEPSVERDGNSRIGVRERGLVQTRACT